jgi:hypothetical protein
MKLLKYFPKEKNGLYIMYEIFSFDNFFRLLLKSGLNHEEALNFVFANCSLSALVWQERIYNRKYKLLSGNDAIDPREAARRAIMIKDFLEAAENAR